MTAEGLKEGGAWEQPERRAVSARSLVDGNAAIWSAMIPGLG